MIQWFAFSQYFPPDHQNGKIIGQLLSAWTRLWNSLTTVFLSIIFCHPDEIQRSPWKLGKLFCMCWQRFFFFFLWFLLCFLSAGLVYAPVRVTGSNMMSKLVLGESNIGLPTQTSQHKDLPVQRSLLFVLPIHRSCLAELSIHPGLLKFGGAQIQLCQVERWFCLLHFNQSLLKFVNNRNLTRPRGSSTSTPTVISSLMQSGSHWKGTQSTLKMLERLIQSSR